MLNAKDRRDFTRVVGFVLAMAIFAVVLLLTQGCSLLQPPDKYVPAENFSKTGPCGTVNDFNGVLKPCE